VSHRGSGALSALAFAACAHTQGTQLAGAGIDEGLSPVQAVSVSGRVVSVYRVDPSSVEVTVLGQCVDEDTLMPSSSQCLAEGQDEQFAVSNIEKQPYEGGSIEFSTAHHKLAGGVGAKAWGGLLQAGGSAESTTVTWLLVRRRFFNKPVFVEGASRPFIRQVSLGSAVTVAMSATVAQAGSTLRGSIGINDLRAALSTRSLNVSVTCREIGANVCGSLKIPTTINSAEDLDQIRDLLGQATMDDPEHAKVVGYQVEWPKDEGTTEPDVGEDGAPQEGADSAGAAQ
jgi:hypothetical protein